MNRITFIIFFLGLFLSTSIFAQEEEIIPEVPIEKPPIQAVEKINETDVITKARITAEKSDGKFNGTFTSFYPNGKIKTTGKLKNNQRTGLWVLWDENGNVRMKRNYKSPLHFEIIFPTPPKKGPAGLLGSFDFSYARDENGMIIFDEIKEYEVYAEKRQWKEVMKKPENRILFEKNRMEKIFFDLIKSKEKDAVIYTDRFREQIDKKDFFTSFDATKMELKGFKIFEVQFFNWKKMRMENRILGLHPIISSKDNPKDNFAEYWFYYPDVRTHFAKEKIKIDQRPEIQNLDDLLFFQNYAYDIYKISNIYDRAISDYLRGDDLKEEQRKIALEQYEIEHNIWLDLYEN